MGVSTAPWSKCRGWDGRVKTWKMAGETESAQGCRGAQGWKLRKRRQECWDPGDSGEGPIKSGVSVTGGTAQNLVYWNLGADS